MDPLSALSISCAIMQVISFSHELFGVAKRIAKDGSPDASLADNVAHLSGLSQILEDELRSQQKTKDLTKYQKGLQEVAQKCLKSSKDLREELEKIKWRPGPEDGGPKVQHRVFRQTWKFLWTKSKIEKLQKNMREAEQAMQSSVLADLWLSQQAALIQQKDSFNSLDDRLQLFIRQFTQGSRKLSELVIAQSSGIKDEVFSQSTKTRDHIAAQFQWQESSRSIQDLSDRLLDSLVYDTMNARKNRVTESHKKTSHWIFDDTIDRPWDSFLEWLKSEDRIYWISGKPGSGKSTLMKFLIDDQRTQDILRERRPGATVVSFFLWNAGTPMQRSVQGLLSALLYQILSMNRELIGRLLTEKPELSRKINYNHWSDGELESVLVESISMSPQPLCIFLDGLDEIDRDEGCPSMVDLIERLRSNTNAKLCISSRPEVEFKDAFRGYPTLRLQDLTTKDISIFVDDFLQKNFQFKVRDGDEANPRQKLIHAILKRADGVFLWVHLVLRSLRRGNVHADSYEQLIERITQLPGKLEDLYKESWKRHGDDENLYRSQAAQYFKLVLEAKKNAETERVPFTLFEFAVAASDVIQKAILEEKSSPPVKSLIDFAGDFSRRIESCCGGLLEVWSHDASPTGEESMAAYVENTAKSFLHQFLIPLSLYVHPESSEAENLPSGGDLAALWNVAYHGRLDFIHRTAADFVLNTDLGRDIIDSDPATSADIQVNIYRSRLVHAHFFTFPRHQRNVGNTVTRDLYDFFSKLQDLRQDIPNELQQNLLALLEDVYERLFDRVYVVDYIITQLRLQIVNGQFDASYYKIMYDIITSYTVGSLRGLNTSDQIKVNTSQIFSNTHSRTAKKIDAIGKACLQIRANYVSNTANLLHRIDWPAGVTKFPVLRRVVPSSDELLGYIFADMFFVIWVLVDARTYLRNESCTSISLFLSGASRMGMKDTLKRCIERRTNVYSRVRNFKETLLLGASCFFEPAAPTGELQEWRNDETISWLLEEGANPNWENPPMYVDPRQLTLFEWFLLSVPYITRRETEASIGRIVATIRAYINAGANLEHISYFSREVRGSATWRGQVSSFELDQHSKHDAFEITIESNIRQLILIVLSFVEDRLAEHDTDIRDILGNLVTESHKNYRRALCVSKVVFNESGGVGTWDIDNAAPTLDDSDHIFKLLDSEKSLSGWGDQVFEAKLQILFGEILYKSKKEYSVNKCLSRYRHVFKAELKQIAMFWQRDDWSELEQFCKALFPDLVYEEDI